MIYFHQPFEQSLDLENMEQVLLLSLILSTKDGYLCWMGLHCQRGYGAVRVDSTDRSGACPFSTRRAQSSGLLKSPPIMHLVIPFSLIQVRHRHRPRPSAAQLVPVLPGLPNHFCAPHAGGSSTSRRNHLPRGVKLGPETHSSCRSSTTFEPVVI